MINKKVAINHILGTPPGGHNAKLGSPLHKMSEGGDVGQPDHLHALAKEAIDAIHAKDPEGFLHATKAIHLHHAGEHEMLGDHEDVDD